MHTREEQMKAFGRLLDVLDQLREKCPWDKKQTNESLRPNTIEETYELCDALARNDSHDTMKELGDVMMHLCFYARIASEQGDYDIYDVLRQQADKLIFRHPHIYHPSQVGKDEPKPLAPSDLPPTGEAIANTQLVIDRYRLAHPASYATLKEFSHELRKWATEAESALWTALRGKNLGQKFRRQHIIGDFIVDFVCLEKQLVIEVDGGYHYTDKQKEADALRTQILNDLGFREIRFSNEEILHNTDSVIEQISTELAKEASPVGGRLEGADLVLQNWEQIKLKEKDGNKTVLSGVPAALPSLIKAYRIQDKARNVGFDWQKKEDVWDKVREELTELEAELKREDKEKSTDELGDFLFSVINAARLYKLNPDNSLERTNTKFIRRFNYIEQHSIRAGRPLTEMTLEEMDALWNEAKQEEKAAEKLTNN